MVKTLLVFRHAKSSRKDNALDDHDRPLNKRGNQIAPLMGEWIAQQNAVPELILSSTAKRAKSTAKKAAKAMGYKGEIRYDKSLYLAQPSAYLQILQTSATEQTRVMLVGHNPGLENLIQTMTGKVQSLPTAALAEIRLDIESWQNLQSDTTGELVHLWLPRELFT
jgi:phosphohistidine phosphatase